MHYDVECTAFEFFKLGRRPAEGQYKVTEHDDTTNYCVVDKYGDKTWYTPDEYQAYLDAQWQQDMCDRNLAFEFEEEDDV